MTRLICVIVSGANDTQEVLVDACIQQRSDAWWHQIDNVWFLETERDVDYWYHQLTNIFPFAPAGCFIFEVANGRRGFMNRAPKDMTAWFKADSVQITDPAAPRIIEG